MKEISALDLRRKFGEVMDEVRYRKEPYIIKKNGRAILVLVDIEVFQAAQGNMQAEAFIEEYSDDRIREFLSEDKIDKTSVEAVQKLFKK